MLPATPMTPSEFDRILKLYQQDKLPEDQRRLVEQWLETKTDYNQVTPIDDKRLAELEAEFFRRIDGQAKVRRLVPVWLKAAAAIMLLAIASYTLVMVTTNEIIEVRTASVPQKIILPDGTLVWLKAESTLSYPEEFEGGTRNVSFSGEALFEVAKDREHPFTIQYHQYTATVLGTSFNLSTKSGTHLQLAVLTGKVQLTSATDAEGVTVTPNRAVIYNGKKLIADITIQENERTGLVEDTQYDMQFRDARMGDIFKKLENKFEVTVDPENESLNNCFMTGDFTDQSLNETLDALSKTLGFEYEVKEKVVTIKGEGCQ